MMPCLINSFGDFVRQSFDITNDRWEQQIPGFAKESRKCKQRPPAASSTAIQAQVAPSLGAPASSRTIRRHLAEGHLGSWRALRVLPLTPTHRRLRLEWCHARGNWTTAEGNQVVFSDESRFNLSSDERPRGERLNPIFALQLHTAPISGVMVWGAIDYNTRSPLVLIRGTMTVQRQGCHKTVSTGPSLTCLILRFVSNRAYLGSFGTASWESYEFERTGSKVTANMERNVSRHHTELVYLNA
ncbi:transposable element Tcb1 transposase [Trichonephila clavipes]|nr:transposable element Tcb1 transposase [Trichonephila clavipes]